MPHDPINPRYILYSESQGRTPNEQLAYDEEVWPGGKMCGFILWIQKHLQAYEKEHGPRSACIYPEAFTQFIRTAAEPPDAPPSPHMLPPAKETMAARGPDF